MPLDCPFLSCFSSVHSFLPLSLQPIITFFLCIVYALRYHLVIVCIMLWVAAHLSLDLVKVLPSLLKGISAFSI